ncbi:hypothetical protein S1OALGB6SA_584 [Olavius algarvensis spirochete endosymbiont]|uniref:ABC transporter permease n=1 Tax=Olavius algarvensis spirochete endosymbiont TaxID=260710 RepID=UPI000F0F1A89|nr:ABC transporter permease [Olavius algarvensis spirochete endosymbiont]VDA99516.1 hypothetical protein S1OALGB6SA_584 [Olavius algarvensis spirochete endosymbiont]
MTERPLASRLKNVLIPFTALLLALLVCAILIRSFGYSPLSVYKGIIIGAAGNMRSLLQTLSESTVLILTGLSFAVAFKAGLINIGAEGQLYMGAVFGSLVGLYLPLPGIIHKATVILVAAAAGGAWAALAGYLKVKFNAHEVITTIMLNTIAANFCSYLVNYPLRASEAIAQSDRLLETAIIPRFSAQSQFNPTFFLALILVIIVYIIVHHTVFGYEMRVTGRNRNAGLAGGINVNRMIIASMALSGAVAGCAGSFHIMAINTRLIDGFSTGFGFAGVAVSALAGGNILPIIFSGILFGVFKNGALVVQRISRIPSDFIQILQALVIIFVAAPMMILAFMDFVRGGIRKITNFTGLRKNRRRTAP